MSIDTPLPSESDIKRKGIFIVVMGVSGTGKSTLGTALAKELDYPYIEGDDLHPKSNVDKMSNGVPLTDEDRVPWLELIRNTAEIAVNDATATTNGGNSDTGEDERRGLGGVGVVATCSALKKYYRDILRGKMKPILHDDDTTSKDDEQILTATYFVWIDGPKVVLQERMEKRMGHFMKASMLESQLNTLESPEGEEGVVVVALEETIEEQVRSAVVGLGTLLGPGLSEG